jgi:hypothetical protein
MVRDRKTGELKTLNIYFLRGKAVSAGMEK